LNYIEKILCGLLQKHIVVAFPSLLHIPSGSKNSQLGIIGIAEASASFTSLLKALHCRPTVH
jgi:hypothetical protein